ncbi:hypothetical protein [Streptomyces sp. NPDC089795]|uniref:hypothetical protein n=1 Tax=Streptomyces sp. NPDC089795 TaxID=3155297 RepID=UPI00342DFC7C
MPVHAQSVTHTTAGSTAGSAAEDVPDPYLKRIEPHELPPSRTAGPDRGDGPTGYEPAWHGV